jgi:hypothetical protein
MAKTFDKKGSLKLMTTSSLAKKTINTSNPSLIANSQEV